jgi:hypothetical protein
MPVRTTRWPLAPHTKIKHEILKRYLNAWLPILGSWAGRVVFIDGFAGPGRYSGGEPGSPVIALQTFSTILISRRRARGGRSSSYSSSGTRSVQQLSERSSP